jgi:hypothetical protein
LMVRGPAPGSNARSSGGTPLSGIFVSRSPAIKHGPMKITAANRTAAQTVAMTMRFFQDVRTGLVMDIPRTSR